MYQVLCIGSATVDNFITIDQPLASIKPGDKILAKSLEKHSGGGATNTAASLSKLGIKTKILTKLGLDHDADFILRELKKYHLKNICRHQSKKNTDSSTLISSAFDKDRIIYVHKGASTDLSTSDFKKSQLKVKWIYLATLMDRSFQTAKYIVNHKPEQTKVLFNPSLYLASKGVTYLKPILKHTSILVLNLEEAQALLHTAVKNISHLLTSLSSLGPQIVVITNGSQRLYAYFDEMIYSLLPPDVTVKHTAGSGDAFTSAFLAGIILRFTLEESLILGQLNASSVIQHLGAKDKLLTLTEAQVLQQKYKIKVKVKKC